MSPASLFGRHFLLARMVKSVAEIFSADLDIAKQA
jgi:hypothetical protein